MFLLNEQQGIYNWLVKRAAYFTDRQVGNISTDKVLTTCSKGLEVQFRTISGRLKKTVRKLHAHFVQ